MAFAMPSSARAELSSILARVDQIVLMPPVRLAKHPGHHLVEHGERGICQSA